MKYDQNTKAKINIVLQMENNIPRKSSKSRPMNKLKKSAIYDETTHR